MILFQAFLSCAFLAFLQGKLALINKPTTALTLPAIKCSPIVLFVTHILHLARYAALATFCSIVWNYLTLASPDDPSHSLCVHDCARFDSHVPNY